MKTNSIKYSRTHTRGKMHTIQNKYKLQPTHVGKNKIKKNIPKTAAENTKKMIQNTIKKIQNTT